MIKQYVLTEEEVEDIRYNIEQIVNRIDQLNCQNRNVDYGDCLSFKEKLMDILNTF